MVSFTSESTIHGVTYIFGENRSIFVRIFWICLFILSIFGLFYYIHGSYIKWLIAPDIITKSRLRDVTEFPSIAFTICPSIMSRVDHIDFKEFKQKVKDRDIFSPNRLECSQFKVNSLWCGDLLGYRYDLSEKCSLNIPVDDGGKMFQTFKVGNIDDGYFYRLPRKYAVLSRHVLMQHGVCTSFNLYSESIFRKESVDSSYDFINPENPSIEWSPDFEYNSINSTQPPRLQKDFSINAFYMAVQNLSLGNICRGKTFKIIIHQPNEIPTRFHETQVLRQ